MKNNDKITLTVGQLKRLIKESKHKIDIWLVYTGEIDAADKELYNIVDSCTEDRSNYRQCHGKTLQHITEIVSDEFGPKIGQYVSKHFIGLSIDPNDWPPSLMFDGGIAASYVAHTLAQMSNGAVFPRDLYGKSDSDIEESMILKEYEIDDDGYDDEGNYVGMDVKYDWERRHGVIYSDPDEVTPYNRRKKHGKWWPNARGDMPGYGDPETWGGREPR